VVFALCIALPVFFDQQSPVRKQAAIAVFLGLVSLLFALSRSAWISFAVAIILFFYLMRTVGWKRLFVPSYTRWIYVGAAAVLLVLVIRIGLPRAASTTRTMEPYGSGITRILLLREAGVVIGLHPIFGVGLAMDTYVFYLRSRSLHIPLVSYFPDPVQNGFVQLLMQVGVVGLLPYFIIMIALGKMIWRRVARGSGKKRLYLAGVAASFLGVVVNAQLQPLLPDVSALVLLIAVLT